MGEVTPTLGVSRRGLDACVACGLCLPHCPTFRITGDEASSPRGRIAAMRAVEDGAFSVGDARLGEIVNSCVGCRGCEVACPARVPFGALLAGTRRTLHRAGQPTVGRTQRLAMGLLGRRRLLRAGSVLLALVQRLGLGHVLVAGVELPIRRPRLVATGTDVVLFTGCVMDAWQREVHADTIAVLAAAGIGATPAPPAAGCCGALHHHAGLEASARRRAERVVAALANGKVPIVVNSAGCGAMLAEVGEFLGTAEAAGVSARVVDLHTLLAGLTLPREGASGIGRVAVSEACHLRATGHGGEVAAVMSGVVDDVVSLDDDGLCCGAGGFFSITRPGDADRIRRRKLASIARSDAEVVVSPNPGCVIHLRAAGVDARHPVQVLAEVLGVGRSVPKRVGRRAQ